MNILKNIEPSMNCGVAMSKTRFIIGCLLLFLCGSIAMDDIIVLTDYEKYRTAPASWWRVAFISTVYARRTLMAGFTTVRDTGGSGVNTSLRDAIAKGYVVGPRIFSSGRGIGTTDYCRPCSWCRRNAKSC